MPSFNLSPLEVLGRAEALGLAMQKMRDGQPIIIKREDGSEEVNWAPED
jgi:hypothetical protein